MSEAVERNMSIFERYLTLWVLLCIGFGHESAQENF